MMRSTFIVLLASAWLACSIDLPQRTCQTHDDCGQGEICNSDGLCTPGIVVVDAVDSEDVETEEDIDAADVSVDETIDLADTIDEAGCGSPGVTCSGWTRLECLADGTVSDIEECDHDAQRCRNGECEFWPEGYGDDCSEDSEICGDELICVEISRVCLTTEPGGLGEPCWDHQECEDGTVCHQPGFTCQTGAIGDPCMALDQCQFGLTCTSDQTTPGVCVVGAEGDTCESDLQCQETLSCGPESHCQTGYEGESCLSSDHCHRSASICYDDICQDGNVGDPCAYSTDCATDLLCGPVDPDGIRHCQHGGFGDPCTDDDHCGGTTTHCAAETCYAGNEGDPCDVIDDPDDCEGEGLFCSSVGRCQDGDEGDYCAENEDCNSAASMFCATHFNRCQDGSEGDPCDDAESDCRGSATICSTFGFCQDGDGPDPCQVDDDCVVSSLCHASLRCYDVESFSQSREIVLAEPCTEMSPVFDACPEGELSNVGGASSWRRTDEPVEIPLRNGIINTSVLGYWPLDGNCVDFSHHGNSVESFAGDPQTTEFMFSGLQFDADDFCWIGLSGEDLNEPYTIQFWYWRQPDDDDATLFELVDDSGATTASVTVSIVGDQLRINQDVFGVPVQTVTAGRTLETGNWYLVTAVSNAAGEYPFQVFVDGERVDVSVDAAAWVASFSPNQLYLAMNPEGNTTTVALDEVMLFARALDPIEIAAYYGSGEPYGTSFVPESRDDYDDIRITETTASGGTQRIVHEIIGPRRHTTDDLENIEAYWPLDVGSDSVTPDDLVFENVVNDLYNATIEWISGEIIPGRFGDDFVFRLSEPYHLFTTDYAPVVGPQVPITIEAWVRVEHSPSPLLGFGSAGDPSIRLDVNESCRFEFTIDIDDYDADWGVTLRSADGVNYCDGQWHHIAGVGTEFYGAQLYVDGILEDDRECLLPSIINESRDIDMFIGGVNNPEDSVAMVGSIAEVIVHNVARSADYFYNRANPGIPMVRFLASTEDTPNEIQNVDYRTYQLHWDSDDAAYNPPLVSAPNGEICEGLLSPCNGYVGWWRFEDGREWVTVDSSVQMRTGVHESPLEMVDGPGGTAVMFDHPIAVRYDHRAPVDVLDLNLFSIEAVVNVDVEADGPRVIVQRGYPGLIEINYYLYLDSDNDLHGGFSTVHDAESFSSVVSGDWEHVAGVYNDDQLLLYENYEDFTGEGDSVGEVTPPTNDTDLGIGGALDSDGGSDGHVFDGAIDMVRIMNRPLETHELLHYPLSQWTLEDIVVLGEGDETRMASIGAIGDPCDRDLDCETLNCQNDSCERSGWAYIPAGEFSMGSDDGDEDEDPEHEVNVSRAFYMLDHEVTQEEWRRMGAYTLEEPDEFGGTALGAEPSYFTVVDGPVESVDWWDAILYANALSLYDGFPMCYGLTVDCTPNAGQGCPDDPEITSCDSGFYCGSITFAGLDCLGYRLPTEAEWEYAYRAGTTTAYYNGNAVQDVVNIAWYGDEDGTTHPVRQLEPNAFGLYDMAGNVAEWVWDMYQDDYAEGSVDDPITDPLTTLTGNRVIRGGDWYNAVENARAAGREPLSPQTQNYQTGFRLVRTVDWVE